MYRPLHRQYLKNILNESEEKIMKVKDSERGKLMNIGQAREVLMRGGTVARIGWNGKGMYVKAQFPDTNSKMTLPYLYMKTADNNFVPWLISQTDFFAEDYIELI